MHKYLYIFNYPPEQEELCKLEVKYLFNTSLFNKYYFTNKEIDVSTSVFIKARIDIYAMNVDYHALLDTLKKKYLFLLDFKVIYLKNDVTHVDYQESLSWCKDISWPIGGSVNMAHPQHTIAVTKLNDTWVVGYYHHGRPTWKKHDNKPHTFSNSLDIRLARTLVNIASEGKNDIKMVDPCCGVGTVVLEGLGLHKDIVGFDISREMSYQARLNVKHFGYDPLLINRCSIHDLHKHYDVAIMDIPYNLYTPITYEEQCALIISARRICDTLVIVTYDDMQKELSKAGFKVKDTCNVKKSQYSSFQRKIYVCN